MARITAYRLAQLKILLGTSGKIITNVDHVRQVLKKPGNFASYKFEPSLTAPAGAHTVDTEEVEQWNARIKTMIAENRQIIREFKQNAKSSNV